MTKNDIPFEDIEWLGGCLCHFKDSDAYVWIRFGDGTNDPNEEEDEEWGNASDPFDDYLMVDSFYDGAELRRCGYDGATSDDGVMIPIHRRDRKSGHIREWFDKACDVHCMNPDEMTFVALTE